eukprot:5208346-Pleurochrysis_carterae.AAC.2
MAKPRSCGTTRPRSEYRNSDVSLKSPDADGYAMANAAKPGLRKLSAISALPSRGITSASSVPRTQLSLRNARDVFLCAVHESSLACRHQHGGRSKRSVLYGSPIVVAHC